MKKIIEIEKTRFFDGIFKQVIFPTVIINILLFGGVYLFFPNEVEIEISYASGAILICGIFLSFWYTAKKTSKLKPNLIFTPNELIHEDELGTLKKHILVLDEECIDESENLKKFRITILKSDMDLFAKIMDDIIEKKEVRKR